MHGTGRGQRDRLPEQEPQSLRDSVQLNEQISRKLIWLTLALLLYDVSYQRIHTGGPWYFVIYIESYELFHTGDCMGIT